MKNIINLLNSGTPLSMPSPFFKTLSAGLVVGFISTVSAIAFAGLIFNGPLSPYLLTGTTACLIGTLILTVFLSIFSSSKYSLGESQDVFAAIVSVVCAKIAHRAYAIAPDSLLPTLIAVFFITSISCGLFMFLLGRFKLGKLIRYIPYPVIGGFLAGTGVLILSQSLNFLTGIPFSIATISKYLSSDILWLWAPALAYAGLVCCAMRRFHHYSVLFFLLLLPLIVFYSYLFITGHSFADVQSEGWLLNPFPVGQLITFPSLHLLSGTIQWQIIAEYIPDYLILIGLSIISLLLNVSSFEMASNQAMDIDKELKVTGAANLLVGGLGGLGGYQSLSLSSINFKLQLNSRIIGIISALSIVLIAYLGVNTLDILPKCLFGILLFYIALDFIYVWLVKISTQINWPDYLVILVIGFLIASKGFLIGLLVGLFLSLLLFVLQYSRIPVIRTYLTGALYSSAVERTETERAILEHRGKEILIPVISGYLFFGNAAFIVQHIIAKAQKSPSPIRYIILDFSRISGMEISCFMSFIKLIQWCKHQKIHLVFTSLLPQIRQEINCLIANEALSYHEFDDLNQAVEWCEDRLIAEKQSLNMSSSVFKFLNASAEENDLLLSYFKSVHVHKNELIYAQGDKATNLIYLFQGKLGVFLDYGMPHQVRIAKINTGALVGEMGLFLNEPRTATVIAEEDSILYLLTESALNTLYKENPGLGLILDRLIIGFLSKRLQHANKFSSYIKRSL